MEIKMKTSSVHHNSVWSRFGLPEHLVFDNGREFHSTAVNGVITALWATDQADARHTSPVTGLLDGEIVRRT
jgi:hypothetical protein